MNRKSSREQNYPPYLLLETIEHRELELIEHLANTNLGTVTSGAKEWAGKIFTAEYIRRGLLLILINAYEVAEMIEKTIILLKVSSGRNNYFDYRLYLKKIKDFSLIPLYNPRNWKMEYNEENELGQKQLDDPSIVTIASSLFWLKQNGWLINDKIRLYEQGLIPIRKNIILQLVRGLSQEQFQELTTILNNPGVQYSNRLGGKKRKPTDSIIQ